MSHLPDPGRQAWTDVPLKCADEPCDPPGSKPKCQICPISPNYWRRTEATEGNR